MKSRWLTAAVMVCLVPLVSRAADTPTENPFKNAKVGDWVSYKMTTSAMGLNFDGEMKQSVTAKDDKSVTLKTTTKINNMEFPGMESKIDLTKPYDPSGAATQGNKNAKVEKIGDGKEKIKVGGKEYDCTWTKYKVVAEAGGIKIDSEMKMWMSKAVPLSGMVKMEMKSKLADVSMEMTGTGNEK